MATGAFVDPIKVLRLAPLVTSTASLAFAHDQDLFFSAWLHPSYRPEANALLPRWFHICLKRALRVIITLYPLSTLFAAANLYTCSEKSIRIWYWSGLAFTAGHFLVFGRRALGLLDKVQYEKEKGQCTRDLREWLDMNFWRSLGVDSLGWVCFGVAAVKSLCLS